MRSGALALYKAAGSTAVLRAASCSVNRFLAGIAGSEQCQPAPATSSSAIRASLVGPINLRGFAAAAEPAKTEAVPVEKDYAAGFVAPHPGLAAGNKESYMLMHPVYTDQYVLSVQPKHVPPEKLHQKAGYYTIQAIRSFFDWATGYGPNMTEAKWLQRMIFLETVAGVPGMVAGMLRHLKSLRTMRRDNGWIHTLLEEAENERMHLLTFLQLRQPGPLFRAAVILAQGAFFNVYFVAYLLSPRFCHSLVGYLEEEAVKTYTHAIKEIDAGKLWKDVPAPPIALSYWKLKTGSNMRDLILAIRADEACHSHVNHTFAGMKKDEVNPFAVGSHAVP